MTHDQFVHVVYCTDDLFVMTAASVSERVAEREERSPPEQSSAMIQIFRCTLHTSKSSIMLGWSRPRRMVISLINSTISVGFIWVVFTVLHANLL